MGQPLGSAISGMLTEPFGRKKALFLVNIPHVIAWLMLYRADNLTMIFIGFAILGLDLGLMEAPIITYLGEIWYDFKDKASFKAIFFIFFHSKKIAVNHQRVVH